jgi:molecular chaperone DnaK (HSP70)
MNDASFALGIDLGTTNSALASVPMANKTDSPKPLAIPQTVAPGETMAENLLPSFLYMSAEAERAPGAFSLPWRETTEQVVGTYARKQGAATPDRLISSAKSWLSYSGIDRRAQVLPWQAPEGIPKISPLEASAQYLAHLGAAWDAAHPDNPLSQQDVVLTVPASFDAAARELTVEAASQIGLKDNLRLLEEPQAALYAWLADKGDTWRDELSVGDTILVCDIGGGTTDFSLISVQEEEGVLQLERVAVGDHILLGGDNMDLALAYSVSAKLEQKGKRLDDWQMRGLVHGCRAAKESLLADESRDTYPLAIASRGSRLMGGTIRTELTRPELEATLLEGFFPDVDASARPQVPRRMGLTTLGLPYASDAAVTRHLAAFLARSQSTGGMTYPTTILFNGGVTRSPVIRNRILKVLEAWAVADGATGPKVLAGGDPDLAVSRGAAFYAQARQQGGLRIKGGTARSYYIGVERSQMAVPGIAPKLDALCIAPFGMEEGTEVHLSDPFGLYVGEPVSFRFFGSSERQHDPVGAVVDPAQLAEVAPIETTLDGEEGSVVHVRLHARVSEVGTLEISAVEVDSERRWKLSFDVRVE